MNNLLTTFSKLRRGLSAALAFAIAATLASCTAFAQINLSRQALFVAPCVAYSVVFTGTTAAGGWNCAAGPGTSGQLLQSNGAGALPTFASNIAIPGTLGVTGATTFHGVTSTGATGTGKLVYDGTPTFVTPNLGNAAYASLNGGGIHATGNIQGDTGFNTLSGNTGSIVSGVATTIFSLTQAGTYLVSAWISNTSAAVFHAVALVKYTGDITAATATPIAAASNLVISVTALGAVQVNQTAGSNQTVQYTYALFGL